MCGIWGYVLSGSSERPPSREKAEECLRSMSHRGPDGLFRQRGDRFSLGHARLAIFDTSALGNQPMFSPDRKIRVVLNGEILNHAELRAELSGMGWQFVSQSDTEVLAAAYRQWGMGCLDRLHGMFAFAVLDDINDSLLLVRDRFGIKPLYYMEQEGMLAFSSEPKGLIPLARGGVGPDLEGISAYLALRHVPAPGTLYREISQVLPGGWLTWDAGQLRSGSWWRLADQRRTPVRVSGRRQRLREEVRRAVELWSRSDVPIAVLLSGGLDSSIIATEVVSTGRAVTFYTGEYDYENYSELAAAQETASALGYGVRAVRARVAVDLEHLTELIRYRDHPLGMHNEVALVELARAISRDNNKVVLCGEGADELMCGYGRLSRLPFEYRKQAWRSVNSGRGWRSHVRSASLRRLLEEYAYLPLDVKLRMLRPEVAAVLDGDAKLLRGLAADWDKPRHVRLHRRLMHFLVTVHLPGLLNVLDGDAMASGVEARVPYLEHQLVAWAYRLPQRAKLRWHGPLAPLLALRESPMAYSERRDTTKWLLRQAFRDVLPPGVLSRRKQPFPAPLNEWLTGPSAEHVSRLVLADGARLHSLFQRDELRRWWASRGDGHPQFGRQAWMLLNLEVWLRAYFPEEQVGRMATGALVGAT
jgi:asparagine synthase (glutamine-hydrolysing)